MDATHRYTAPEAVARYRSRALLAGAGFLVVGAVLAFALGSAAGYGGLAHVFRSYLVGFFFCTGLAVGSLAWLALGHMTGGAWALTSRRLFEAATRTLPLCLVLFIPVVVAGYGDCVQRDIVQECCRAEHQEVFWFRDPGAEQWFD